MELLDHLKQEKNLTLLFICHDLALVQAFCDRVLVMEQGKIVESGTPDEVIRNPRQAYTRLLIESASESAKERSKNEKKEIMEPCRGLPSGRGSRGRNAVRLRIFGWRRGSFRIRGKGVLLWRYYF